MHGWHRCKSSRLAVAGLVGLAASSLRCSATARDCTAFNRDACLQKTGCRWFSHRDLTDCPLCRSWFGGHDGIAGCRDWIPDEYCKYEIVGTAHAQHGADLASLEVRNAVEHYQIAEGGFSGICSIWCNPDQPGVCFGQVREDIRCAVSSEDECLGRQGCNWFEYTQHAGCKLCDSWFGNQASITGCRAWGPDDFCTLVFDAATHKYGGRPSDAVIRQVIDHYRIMKGGGMGGISAQYKCDVFCEWNWPWACSSRPAPASDCWALSAGECLAKSGCRWFTYEDDSDCPLCDRVFGDRKAVTGCHDWDPGDYCGRIIFQAVQTVHNGDPHNRTVREAVRHFRIQQGSGEEGDPFVKDSTCSIWCDEGFTGQCFGQPRANSELKGVNYGGRFVPEKWLGIVGTEDLFKATRHPTKIAGARVDTLSLCDVGEVWDASHRMERFLNNSISPEHFKRMADLGFNIVRLPLGYWNLIDLPGGVTPNGPASHRWRRLQKILTPAVRYHSWIDRVFSFARQHGLKILLDLHGAPGGQTDNAFTGCNQGRSYFDTDWNRHLAARADEEMARICGRHSDVCWGIELLNEPSSPGGPTSSRINRDNLRLYYDKSIKAARRHMHKDVPIVIMDWPAWLSWWKERRPFTYRDHGRIVFATHIYHLGGATHDQWHLRQALAEDVGKIADFRLHSRYEIMVSEYSLANTVESYNSLANWYVHQFNQHGLGSMVWNFDAGWWMPSWGSVMADKVRYDTIQWKGIFSHIGI